ncbi:hypothetical protein GKQ38_05355 [Candidatus Nanohaloarchaea archaeon]|nr:hypothetical protein GKQ38_05355 [Candidatus Nanohaloarchaea archaeon]
MTVSSISAGLIVRSKKLLVFYNEEEDAWDVPTVKPEKGELSADAAKRVSESFSGVNCSIKKYRKKLKTQVSGENWNPYVLEVDGEPERGEWVTKNELKDRDLVPHIEEMKEKFAKKI